jgi:hypothetical protein
LTTGGTGTWAICLGCDQRGGRSLRAGWSLVLSWMLLPIALLFAALVVLYLMFGKSLSG